MTLDEIYTSAIESTLDLGQSLKVLKNELVKVNNENMELRVEIEELKKKLKDESKKTE